MKKLISLLMAVTMLTVPAMACDDILLPETTHITESTVHLAVVNGVFELAGITSPDESVALLPMQGVCKNYIRGFADEPRGAMIRAKAAIQILEDGTGLASFTNVKVILCPNYTALVHDIVKERLGEEADAEKAANILACTFWRMDSYISHIFFTSRVQHFAVGKVIFNDGADEATLYAGDFDGDGKLELGFEAGYSVRKPVPTPNKPCESKVRTGCSKSKGCFSISIKLCVGINVNICVK